MHRPGTTHVGYQLSSSWYLTCCAGCRQLGIKAAQGGVHDLQVLYASNVSLDAGLPDVGGVKGDVLACKPRQDRQ